jgi:hypothetical protein
VDAEEAMTPKGACPSCGNDVAHPGIALVGPFDARGANGEPCEDAFHDEPESTDCGKTLRPLGPWRSLWVVLRGVRMYG